MRIMLIVVLIGILAVTGYGLYFIRTVTHDPDVWHVDPRSVPPADTPNTVRVARASSGSRARSRRDGSHTFSGPRR